MKLIDDKGRIFGKINIIDFIIILFLSSLLSMFYYGYKLFYFHPKPKKNFYTQTLSIKGLVYDIAPEVLKKINKGDKAFDFLGTEIGEITDVGEIKRVDRKISLGNDSIMVEDSALPLSLNLKGKIENDSFIFNNKIISFNKSIDFKTTEYELKIFVIDSERETEKKEFEFKTIRVMALAESVFPEVADLVSEGDMEYMKSNQTGGNLISGKIISILKKDNSKIILINKEDKKIEFVENPQSRDIELVFNLNVQKKENQIYYNNVPIKIGESFIFETARYNLNCRTLEIINDK